MVMFLLMAWTFGALYFDFPVASNCIAWAFIALELSLPTMIRGPSAKALAVLTSWLVVLVWWLTQQPRNDRPWQPDVAQTAWAEIHGDEVVLHNVRNCDYRTAQDYSPRWEERMVHLSKLTGLDLAVCYWGSPYMAHPIASFQFADAAPICVSIETRKELGESYSAIGGLYRQFELIYLVAEERDVIRLRTHAREGEEVFLYRLRVSPDEARERFMDYLRTINDLHEHPRWYHAITTNCTTAIRAQRDATKRAPWDWRMLVNGKGDELLFERSAIVTDGLPFAELRTRARIHDDARLSDSEFSQAIRRGRPGFSMSP